MWAARSRPWLVLVVASGCGGSGVSDVQGDSGLRSAFSETDAFARARNFKQLGFIKINASEVTTTHRGSTANVWVSPEAASAYRAIDPAGAMSSATLPSGTQVIKEHAGGSEAGVLLVMTKGNLGADPERNDWHWARIEKDGTPSFAGFRSNTAAIQFCLDCHQPAKKTDFVFGTATTNRSP